MAHQVRLSFVLLLLVWLASAAGADSGWNYRVHLQTDERCTVACNPAGKALSSVLSTTVTVRHAGETTDGTPAGILDGGVTINAAALTLAGRTCPAAQCVVATIKPVCASPPNCRDGTIYQVHVNAAAADVSRVDCDLRVDGGDVVYEP